MEIKSTHTQIQNLNLWPQNPPKMEQRTGINAKLQLSGHRSRHKYLLGTHYVPGTVLGAEGSSVNGTEVPALTGLPS